MNGPILRIDVNLVDVIFGVFAYSVYKLIRKRLNIDEGERYGG